MRSEALIFILWAENCHYYANVCKSSGLSLSNFGSDIAFKKIAQD